MYAEQSRRSLGYRKEEMKKEAELKLGNSFYWFGRATRSEMERNQDMGGVR
jgi:hypothetical protein